MNAKVNTIIETFDDIIETFDDIIETFEGIRKDNSRLIFIILLTIIIMDCLMDCFI